MEYFQLKIKDFTRKIDYQNEIIHALQKKL
jgi:hypothetical protein